MNEQTLYELKWFDYRLMPPQLATLAFIRQYGVAKTEFLDDRGYGRHVNIFKNLDIEHYTQWKKFGTFTKLRQIADKNNCRYSDFWVYACQGHLDLGFKNHFENAYLNPRLLKLTLDKCAEHARKFVRYSYHWFFKPENYMALELQKDYYEYLVKEIKVAYPLKWREELERLAADGKISRIFLQTHISKSLGERA